MTSCFACKIVAIFLAVVAMVGNTLVCHVIVRLKTMKTSINYIILNLAVMDAIIGILTIPFVFVRDYQGLLGEPLLSQAYNQSSTLADVNCKIQWTFWFPFNVSPLLLMIMAYERFKAIVHPLSRLNDTATKSRLKWMLPLSWMLAAAFTVIEMTIIRYDSNTSSCYFAFDMNPWYNRKVVLFVYLLTDLVLPSAAMLVLYGRIVCTLRKQDNELGPRAEAVKARRKASKKVMWIIIVITFEFYICCGIPSVTYTLYIFFGNSLSQGELMSEINIALVTFNSAFNPLVYFFFMQSFRHGFKRVFWSKQIISVPNIKGLELNTRPRRSLGNGNENAENAS